MNAKKAAAGKATFLIGFKLGQQYAQEARYSPDDTTNALEVAEEAGDLLLDFMEKGDTMALAKSVVLGQIALIKHLGAHPNLAVKILRETAAGLDDDMSMLADVFGLAALSDDATLPASAFDKPVLAHLSVVPNPSVACDQCGETVPLADIEAHKNSHKENLQ